MLGRPCMSRFSMIMKLPLPRSVPPADHPGAAQPRLERCCTAPQCAFALDLLWRSCTLGCRAHRQGQHLAAQSGAPLVREESLCLQGIQHSVRHRSQSLHNHQLLQQPAGLPSSVYN